LHRMRQIERSGWASAQRGKKDAVTSANAGVGDMKHILPHENAKGGRKDRQNGGVAMMTPH